MVFARIPWLDGIAKNVMTADGLIAAEKDISTPFARENPLGRSGFVTRVYINRAPPFRRPTDDLDGEIVGLLDKTTVAAKRFRGRIDDRNRNACRVRRNIRIQVVGGIHGKSFQGNRGHEIRACRQSNERVTPFSKVQGLRG